MNIKKLLKCLTILTPAFLLTTACRSNGGGEGGEDEPDPTPITYAGLKLTSQQDNSKIGYSVTSGNVDVSGIKYSFDGVSWTDWTDGSQITLDNNKTLCVKNTKDKLSVSLGDYFSFSMDGKIAASGDVSSMINYSPISECCYCYMFSGCAALTSVPDLPATSLAFNCYREMFERCSSLTTVPAQLLPAEDLDVSCYEEMFQYCSKLTNSPNLPSTHLADSCYDNMFYGCPELTMIPDILPADTLKFSCYAGMFTNCSKLTIAPKLPATELQEQCYYYMFSDCSSLTIKEETGSTDNPNKIFTCPTIKLNSVTEMFSGTKDCSFNMGEPTAGNTYSWCE